ncbi:hypothetical protein [Herbaspirillum sp. NPDC101396]|uniref:hypothetical protein n=1 Tax=Herbaspirillum sp. NPDC101396 TaxID=3364005 RepID=UPI00383ACAF4
MGRFGSRFMSTFARHGMLSTLEIQVAGETKRVDVGYEEGGTVVIDGIAHAVEHYIEYEKSLLDLRRGTELTVDGMPFKVKRPPDPKGDGTFCIAFLEPA